MGTWGEITGTRGLMWGLESDSAGLGTAWRTQSLYLEFWQISSGCKRKTRKTNDKVAHSGPPELASAINSNSSQPPFSGFPYPILSSLCLWKSLNPSHFQDLGTSSFTSSLAPSLILCPTDICRVTISSVAIGWKVTAFRSCLERTPCFMIKLRPEAYSFSGGHLLSEFYSQSNKDMQLT